MKLGRSTYKDLIIHLLLMVAIGSGLILFFFFVYLPSSTNHGETITVPDLKGVTIEAVDGSLAHSSIVGITKTSNHVDESSRGGCRMKVGGRKDMSRIAKDPGAACSVMNDDIVVDVEIRVVVIFMFSADLDKATVWESGKRLTKPVG